MGLVRGVGGYSVQSVASLRTRIIYAETVVINFVVIPSEVEGSNFVRGITQECWVDPSASLGMT